MRLPGRGVALLAVPSLLYGIPVGFAGMYLQLLQFASHFTYSPDPVFGWLLEAVGILYPLIVYYWLGARLAPGFGVGRAMLSTYGGVVLGGVLGVSMAALLPVGGSGSPSFAFVLLAPVLQTLPEGLTFVFIAFTGVAFARLSRVDQDSQRQPRTIALCTVAFFFAMIPTILSGVTQVVLDSARGPFSPSSFALFGYLSAANFVISLPVAFAVFYYIGRGTSVRGRTLTCFGLLFGGLYAGSVAGAALILPFFGPASWALAAGETTSTTFEGFVLTNVPGPLLFVFAALDPLAHIPFLSFAALSLSHLRKKGEEGAIEESRSAEQAQGTV